MRRLICAVLLVAGSVGILAIPVSADPNPNPNPVILSFDFSDNTAAASVTPSQGPFNVIVDVLPGNAAGLIRMFAVAPAVTNDPNLVCRFHLINQSQVECAFNFPDAGVWSIHAQYQTAPDTDVVGVAVTNLRVNN